MSQWRTHRPVALTFLTLFLVVQLAIPLSRMGEGTRSQRYGWQMFSLPAPPIEFTVLTHDKSQVVDLEEV